MSSPVATVDEDAAVRDAAKIMKKRKIGSVIVTSKDGKPVGIVTSDDIVRRLVVKDLKPSEVPAKRIMSHPVIAISPEAKVEEAVELMRRRDVERLAVMDYDKMQLVGVVSAVDITRIAPMVFAVNSERLKIQGSEEELSAPPLAGYCDECGEWSDVLREIGGKFICRDCKEDYYKEV